MAAITRPPFTYTTFYFSLQLNFRKTTICCKEIVLLHLYQPIEPGTEELGRVRPNVGMTYPRTNEQFISFFFSCAKT
jgi:hypothetical protein